MDVRPLLLLAICAPAFAADPDEFPVEPTPSLEAPVAEPVAPVEAPPAEAQPAQGAPVEPAPTPVGEWSPPPATPPEPPPRRTVGTWIDNAASDVGDAFRSVWRGKDREAPAEDVDAALAIPAESAPEAETPAAAPSPASPAAAPPAPGASAPPTLRPARAPEAARRDDCACDDDGDRAHPEREWRFHQHTLLGEKRRSGRFAPYVGGTALASAFGEGRSVAWGFEGGVVLGGHVVLAGAGYGTGPFPSADHDVRLAYAGFQPGLVLWSGSILHPRFDVLLGSAVAFDAQSGRLMGVAPVVVPRLGAELNVSRSLRLSGNVGWRFVGAPGDARDALSGLEAGVTLRFGWM